MKKNYVYDLETYPNFFCGVFNNDGENTVFEISARKNDFDDLLEFYLGNIEYAIGFNNLKFDAQVMQYLISNRNHFKTLLGSQIVKEIYKFVQDLINTANEGGFPPYPEWKIDVAQIDLYLMNHYNNKNKSTSLKWIEFQIDHDKVQDLPYRFDQNLREKQFDEVIEYCKNDVRATRDFADKCRDLIKLRLSQEKQYPDLNLRNKSDSSVGESIFLAFMSDAMGIPAKELKKKRTPRGSIYVEDILLPYINFKTPEFQEVLDFYKSAWSGGLSKTVKYKGINYEFGEGGLHASCENKIFEEDAMHCIVDLDVASFYPNLAIVNGYRPEHLGSTFSKIYKQIYDKRRTFPKGSVENLSYKLLLNSVYGKSGDEYSFLYDPQMTLQICVNGQLLLAMLAERLSLVPGCEIIQANTDGVTIYVKRSELDQVDKIRKGWERLTGLELEDVGYKKMVISNVNNYAAMYQDGKIKEKGGLYSVDTEFHKNKSQRVVRIALREYFFRGVPIRETIENHVKKNDQAIYDYCLGRKVKWNQNFVLIKGVHEESIKQKVIRFYITREKATMMKKYNDGRQEAVSKGYNAKLFQDYEKKDDYGINFEYYINEAYKITTPFDKGNPKIGLQLSLFEE